MKTALKIVCKDGDPFKAEVYLDHRRLDHILNDVEIRIGVGSMPRAILTSVIHDVEVDFEECQIKFNGHFVDQQLAYQAYQDLKKFFEQEIPPGFLGLKKEE
ncbi:MAG: hypothetical protein JRH08_00650 [Deltaproteobacteria bacterium]|nr:hypothetical protein [Deltaproteobacteria bacterium]MBW2124212.1 hypothetical protein [Deltaproteobacteria bacterium]